MVGINHPLLFNLLSVEMQELYLKMIDTVQNFV